MSGMTISTQRLGTRTASNVSVTAAATQLAAANTNRKSLVLQNNGSVTVYLGNASVAASGPVQGLTLAVGASFVDTTSGDAWFAVTSSSAATIHVEETS